MKTREQAEQRANELWKPINPNNEHLVLVNASRARQRQAFLQCWDEMQKFNQKELLCEIMRKDEESFEPYK